MDSEIKNAIISGARLEICDRGFLDACLMLDYGVMAQSFGGYCLYLPKSFDHHKLLSHAGHFLFRSMEIAGVERWDAMRGCALRARVENGLIQAIGHIVKDDWFCPENDFKKADA